MTQMSNQESIEERLREVEKTSATVMVSLADMKSDIHEVKQMFQKFLVDSVRLSELSAKVDHIDKLESKTDTLFKKVDLLNSEFQTVKTQHVMCQSNKGRSDQLMQDLHERMIKIELAVTALTASKKKVQDTVWDWLKNGIAAIFLFLMLLILLHAKDLKILPQETPKPPPIEERYRPPQNPYPEYYYPNPQQNKPERN